MMKWHGLNRLIKKGIKTGTFLLLLLIIFVVMPGYPIASGEQVESLETFTRQLEKRIISEMDWYTIPGIAIVLVQDGETVWSNAYGYADIEEGKRMNIDAICRAESISKSVTAWGVMKLAEQGQINLDTPVQQYLNHFQLSPSTYSINEVTVRRLLSNSAGMPLGSLGQEYAPNEEKPSLRQYLAKEVELVYEPGSAFEYSNPGFNLLELLIEEVTGRNFNEYMENEVLLPLGMRSSSYGWREEWSTRVPMGYDLQGNPVAPYVYPYKASGGLFSTVEDIARFAMSGVVEINKGGVPVLRKESIRQIQSPQVEATGIYGLVADYYGFGHFIEELDDGRKAVWHGGQGHGWMTHLHLLPESGDGIIIFSNSQRSWPLIASLLDDWSRWKGYSPVKFSRINRVVAGLWAVTVIIYLVSLWYSFTIAYGFWLGNRRFLFSLRLYSKRRVVEAFLWLVLLSTLVWSASQEYLFVTSVFPKGSTLLGWGLVFLFAVLMFSIIFPIGRGSKKSFLKIGSS